MAKPCADWTTKANDMQSLRLGGSWSAAHAAELEALLDGLPPPAAGSSSVEIDGSGLVAMDTLGAYLLHRLRVQLGAGDLAGVVGLRREQEVLLNDVGFTPARSAPVLPDAGAYRLLTDVGEAVIVAGRDLSNGVAFLGQVIVVFGRLLTGQTRLRLTSVVTHLERVALRSVPIIVLISFLVGAIIAQQSIFQLMSFGSVHFTADLIGILVMRELGVLLTAIMIAGRSGSSITAELGSMKMREEIDALETMGLDPMEVLVLPRILALVIGLPLLSFVASMAAISGGAVVAYFYGGVSAEVFFGRLQNAVAFNTFMVGIIKAPFMALVIGMIACIEGFAVRGSAESLGQHTTASVVKSIFIVIVVDGLFAMFFASIKY